mgnify:CR=1 FL=1
MNMATNLFPVLGQILHIVLTIYLWIVVIGALLSWVNPDPSNPVVYFLRRATEPVFSRIRQSIPLLIGGIDLTPIVVISIIIFLDYAGVKTLTEQGNIIANILIGLGQSIYCLLYTSPSPRDRTRSRMPSSA